MKYHYQFVSKTTVRIELIPEDKKERIFIEKLSHGDENNDQLRTFFKEGLAGYASGTILTKTKFMNFPTVALCNYTNALQTVNNVA